MTAQFRPRKGPGWTESGLQPKTKAARRKPGGLRQFWSQGRNGDIDCSHNRSHVWVVKTISKGRLKAQMLAVFRDLERTGGELVVTDHGRPVLKVVSLEAPPATFESAFADVRGKVRMDDGVLLAPTTAEWSEV